MVIILVLKDRIRAGKSEKKKYNSLSGLESTYKHVNEGLMLMKLGKTE